MSRSVSEFWRRWHMTLGEWFKENIYFPLGGSKCKTSRVLLNLTVVWVCTGVWHALCFPGNGVNFMLWAAFLLAFILLEKLGVLSWITENCVLSHIYLPFVILFSWAIFNTNITTLADLGSYISRLFPIFAEVPEYVNPQDWLPHLNDVGIYMAIGVIFLTPLPRKIYESLKQRKVICVALMLLLFWLSVYFVFVEGANPMVY
jgi:alginate O-acetyltransferase complex protein AlgI